MKLKSLHDLLVEQLKDLYSAENQLVKALPKMAKAATNPDLKAGFKEHLEQTRGQVARLETDLRAARRQPQGEEVRGDGGAGRRGQGTDGGGRRAGRARRRADRRRPEGRALRDRQLRLRPRPGPSSSASDEAAQLLQETLDEEKATDEKLTELAMAEVNEEADEAADPPPARSPRKRRSEMQHKHLQFGHGFRVVLGDEHSPGRPDDARHPARPRAARTTATRARTSGSTSSPAPAWPS